MTITQTTVLQKQNLEDFTSDHLSSLLLARRMVSHYLIWSISKSWDWQRQHISKYRIKEVSFTLFPEMKIKRLVQITRFIDECGIQREEVIKDFDRP